MHRNIATPLWTWLYIAPSKDLLVQVGLKAWSGSFHRHTRRTAGLRITQSAMNTNTEKTAWSGWNTQQTIVPNLLEDVMSQVSAPRGQTDTHSHTDYWLTHWLSETESLTESVWVRVGLSDWLGQSLSVTHWLREWRDFGVWYVWSLSSATLASQ